ncbi:hypothetical protein DL93DRAFT_2083664 [Clavulina sp. PMI_390]|nr:hypothetical protein DL93DRAFT_2083664 [Clavulina sp. PMI_390]
MPNLVSLELVDLSYQVFTDVVHKLPDVTNRRIEKLLIACREQKPDDNFILPLNAAKQGAEDQMPPFPNLQGFALRDADPRKKCEWSIDFEVMEALAESRRGTLTQLVLPSAFRPLLLATERVLDDNPAPKQALTIGQESRLKMVGNLAEIAYDFTIDSHGLSEMYPRYSAE